VKTISKRLGLKSTVFTNAHGFTESGDQMSSAADIAKMVTALSQVDFLADYFTTTLDYVRDGNAQLVNSNRLVRVYKGTIGFKFGYSDESDYCLAAAAERDGNRYGVVLLGFEDEDDMYERAKALLNNGFNAYTSVTPEIPKDIPATIPIKGAFLSEVPIIVSVPRKLIIHKSDTGKLEAVVALPDYIYAPAKKGELIGEIGYYLNNEIIYTLPILAGKDTAKLNFGNNLSLLMEYSFNFG
jgi:D-alanyl-D-alanine carboxypeptidase (penicillin-binding protein 5/6)